MSSSSRQGAQQTTSTTHENCAAAESTDADADAGLKARIQSHARAFESLLALTPAREVFGSQIADGREPSDQWKRRKQTAEEKRAAKRAKLDPANQVSALDVLREREAKRKREVAGLKEDEGHEMGGKKRKSDTEEDEERGRKIAEKRREKRREKKARAEKKKAKREAKKAVRQRRGGEVMEKQVGRSGNDEDGDDGEDDGAAEDSVTMAFDASGLVDAAQHAPKEQATNQNKIDGAASNSGASSAPSSPVIESPAFDIPNNHHSATSSTSSILPPSEDEHDECNKALMPSSGPQPKLVHSTNPTIDTTIIPAHPQPTDITTMNSQKSRPSPPSGTSSPKLLLPNIDPAVLQSRLRARIDALRAARKADSNPAQSRQDLLEQRRKKEELRRAAKKEARRRAREEEAARREEELKAAGGSREGSWGGFSPKPATAGEGLAFSRLTFGDGTVASASGREVLERRKTKGPQDPRTALLAAETKQRRLAGYDVQKREEIAEKDRWAQAKQRARGERGELAAKEPSLLKKALKRQEKAKEKSERAWKERERKVVEGLEARQRRRESNLAKRREEKKKGKAKAKAKKGRPGFEGRFKA